MGVINKAGYLEVHTEWGLLTFKISNVDGVGEILLYESKDCIWHKQ